MKKILLVLATVLGFSSLAQADGTSVKYDKFRNNVLRLFRASADQGIIYKRFKGTAYVYNSTESCEVQLKSTATSTTLNVVFPTSNRQQVQVEFAYDREISEQVGIYQFRYSSHYVSCSGDQYDAHRDCWEYDQYEMKLEKAHDDFSGSLAVSFRGQSCIVKI